MLLVTQPHQQPLCVVGGVNVVFFQTRLKPSNHDNPIRQSNGLREYMFPKGLEVEILKAA